MGIRPGLSRLAACCVFVAALVLLPSARLEASGRADDEEAATVRDTWVLVVTRFDHSMLSPGRRVVGEVITRNILEKLDTVSYRLRLCPEIAFYESYEWRRSVQTTAQALARRQNDRSLLIFRGEPNWRHRRDLRRHDEDIARLQEELALRKSERPVVNVEPTFALSQANLNNNFPEPPAPGGERRFTLGQNADAFLAGDIREFHGRFFVSLRLYVLYLDAFVYEDDIIFSMDDIDGAVTEIATRLTSALSGNPPARIAIRAYPPDAQILVNRGYAGTGEMEARDRPPGRIEVAVAADGHAPKTVELDLAAGETVEVEVALGPLPMAEVTIDVPDADGVAVYHGALFLGETPLTMRLPIGSLADVHLEDPITGKTASAVVFAPDMPGEVFDFTFTLRIPHPSGERRVNNARARFYWAWAGFWGALITHRITSGISDGRNSVLHLPHTPEFFAGAQRAQAINTGALILMGPAIGYAIFELSRYLGASNENAISIARRNR